MSCVLRVTAPDIATAAHRLAVKPYRVEGNCAHFDVSVADFDDLAGQIADAIAFLKRHKAEVDELMALPSSDGVLDFGVARRHVAAQFGRLSAELVCLAGKAGLALELSLYPVGEETEV